MRGTGSAAGAGALAVSAAVASGIAGCRAPGGGPTTFGDDVAFLERHTRVIVLADEAGRARVAVAPAYQGRVMTSTATGPDGLSFGWMNREVVASGKRQAHMTVLGGEDRMWLGPEGGQFSLYFERGRPFDLDHWQVPEVIDWGPWEVVSADRSRAAFRARCRLVNWSGTAFDLVIDRTVRLLPRAELRRHLGADVPAYVEAVACESENRLTNAGPIRWSKESGLVSIWILSMFNPSPATTVVIPFRADPRAPAERIVNDAYFGRVPPERLIVEPDRGILFFKADGLQRGKIGIRRDWALPVLGAYDAAHGVLTIVQFTLPPDGVDYVNSMWALQDDPYGGDVANSYNDGPPAPGAKPLGPFYELESSSPALALAPGESGAHVHRTFHLQGTPEALDPIARALLGVGVGEIARRFE